MNFKKAKTLAVLIAVGSLLLLGGQAFAELCAIDAVPAATLLLPYFEVDLSTQGGRNTLFSVNNASAAPQIAHVTLWTDLSRPTLDFDIFLTGYDVFTANLGSLFFDGFVPQTGPFPNYQDPGDPVNGPGDFSFPNNAPPGPGSCDFPLSANIPASLLAYIRAAHTGFPAPAGFDNSGLCSAVAQNVASVADGLARGYITVDVVNDCSLAFPGNPGYFAPGGQGTAANDNVLWGDFFLVDPANGFAQGEPLVHVEATNSPDDFVPGDYTFYGRYVNFDASDAREPLATTWAARYFMPSGAFNASEIVCWRDTGRPESAFFLCGTLPNPFPLSQSQIVIFDEHENPIVVDESDFSPPPTLDAILPCPWETQKNPVDDAAKFGDIPWAGGWLYLNLNTSTGSVIDPHKQSWVMEIHSTTDAAGIFSVGYQAVSLNSACDPMDIVLPVPPPA